MASLADLATDEGEMASEIKETLKTNKTLLHSACSKGDVGYLGALLGIGLDIEAKDDKGRTPLFEACSNQEPECVQLLLEKGANPNATSLDGHTPLTVACIHSGNSECVRHLLAHGAKPNVRDIAGQTPLFWACTFNEVESIRLLLDNKAVPDIVDRDGLTPMARILRLFRHDEDTLACIRLLLEHGVSSNAVDNVSGDTLLHTACKKNAPRLIQLLLKNGANPGQLNKRGRTPMQTVTKCLRKASAADTDALMECKKMLQEALEELEASRKRPRVESEEEEDMEEGEVVFKVEPIAKRVRHE